MEQKQFKAESKRLLDMMIHSIYTHKEIFLRELISNASDAIDKLYFKSLTDDKVGLAKDDFAIWISADKDSRTLKITDNGIGMTAEELENNLGTIANSGSLKFKTENKLDEDNQIIGQFGVGFYSAFMVAKKVTVITKATALMWLTVGNLRVLTATQSARTTRHLWELKLSLNFLMIQMTRNTANSSTHTA